ncbi:MAG: hypothetical protein EOM15_08975, partial [Spirochaetia bacterium]|nr:hypothetical protein [Spirochaetia bacterium]
MIVRRTGIIDWIEMNHKSIEELGFFQVLAHMKAKSMSEEGQKRLDSLEFLHDRDLLAKRQQEVAAAVDLLIGGLSLESFPPIAQTLESLNDPIKQIDCSALLDIALYIRAAKHLCDVVYAEYSASLNRLTVHVKNDGSSTSADVAAAIGNVYNFYNAECSETHPVAAVSQNFTGVTSGGSESSLATGSFTLVNGDDV